MKDSCVRYVVRLHEGGWLGLRRDPATKNRGPVHRSPRFVNARHYTMRKFADDAAKGIGVVVPVEVREL